MRRRPLRVSRRSLMYLIVAAQVAILAAIVVPQELNIALDSGVTVDIEVAQAHVRTDPFRGAYVSGRSALDLDGRTAMLPRERLRPGEHVLVFFTPEAGHPPRIARVERERRVAPPFTSTSFSIPGRVRESGDRSPARGPHGDLVARVGDPPVSIDLELPASIPVDASAAERLAGPSLIRARLHAGFLGRRYLTDVRLIGRAWPPDVSFAYDATRQRLVVLAPRQARYRGPGSRDDTPRSDVFVFDAAGKEVAAAEVEGRLIDGALDSDGHMVALVSDKRWSQAEVSLAQIDERGQVLRRSAPIAFDRILGFDGATGSAWILTGPPSRRRPPHFVQRLTLEGLRQPRLGPFASVPKALRSVDGQLWAVETDRHRITRLDLESGRTTAEYRDLNGPIDVAVDGGSIYVIEAKRTELARLAEDGRVLWRIPRFQGLAWVVPEPGTGGGWVGASRYDGRPGGVLRFGADGSISPVAPGASPEIRSAWRRRRLGTDAVRSVRNGRLYFLEKDAIAILGVDDATVTRVVGFRFPGTPRLRS